MKKGTVVLIFTSLAYLVTVIFIVTNGFVLDQPFVGEDSLVVLEELSVAEKTTAYIDQAVRNALYLADEELEEKGLFAEQTCIYEKGAVVLYSAGSCELTQQRVEDLFLETFWKHFTPSIEEPVFMVPLKDFITKEQLSLTMQEGKITFTGVATSRLPYQGKKVTYRINPSFQETIIPSSLAPVGFVKVVSTNLGCILQHKEAFVERCSLPGAHTWKARTEGDFLFIDVLSEKNIAFSFAINLKTTQQTSNTLFI